MGERADRAAHRFLLVSLWVSATVIAGVITWAAVTRLGQEAGADPQTTLTQSEVRRELSRVVTPPATSGRPTVTPPATTRATPDQPPTTQNQPPRHYRGWNVTGGHVSASCRGSIIHLEPTTPSDGWEIRVKDTGPDKVTVEFSRGDSETKVEVTCVGGIPVLENDN